jgi:thioredoxin 1
MNHTIPQLDASQFDATIRQGTGVTVVDFWADWCRPCHALAPTLDALSQQYAGTVRFAKVNVDQQNALAAEFDVRSIPTLIVFQDGEEVGRLLGAQPKASIEHALGHVLEPHAHQH